MRILDLILVLVLATIGMNETACAWSPEQQAQIAGFERHRACFDWLMDLSPLLSKAYQYEGLPIDGDSWEEVCNYRWGQLDRGNQEAVLALDAALEYSKKDDAIQSIREKLFDTLVALDPSVVSIPALKVLYLNLSEQPKRHSCPQDSLIVGGGECVNGTWVPKG